jgi:hypothetical protein
VLLFMVSTNKEKKVNLHLSFLSNVNGVVQEVSNSTTSKLQNSRLSFHQPGENAARSSQKSNLKIKII